jgi:hypothetical protein
MLPLHRPALAALEYSMLIGKVIARTLIRRLVPGALWFAVVVFPALTARDVTRAEKARLASHVFGELTEPYLQVAPGALLVYSIAASFWSVPLFLLLVAGARVSPDPVSKTRRARYEKVGAVVLEWALTCLAGYAVVAVAASMRGDSGELIAGWGLRLGAVGLLTGLPGVGLVLLGAVLFRRRWLSIVSAIAAIGALSFAGRALLLSDVRAPLPVVLRAELLSGRAELMVTAVLGAILWAVAPLALALWLTNRGSRGVSRAVAVVTLTLSSFGVGACSSDDSNGEEPGPRLPPEGWAESSEAERCGIADDTIQESCGEPPRDAPSRQAVVDACVSDYRRESSIGCGEEWDTYQACLASQGPLDCDVEEPCSRELDAAFSCRSAFTTRTGCTPNSRTSECTAERPVPLYCTGALPAGCTENASSDPVPLVCCSAFD